MYDDHLRLTGKHGNFLLVLIELFSLGVTAEAPWANIGSKSAISLQWGPADPKFQVEGVAPTNHSSSQKTRLNNLSYGIKIWTDHSSILSQFTRLLDRQTEFSSLDCVCIPCSAVKTAPCWASQLPTTSQHHSPTRILPHNLTNIRIHAHTTPTHTSPTRAFMLTMVQGFS